LGTEEAVAEDVEDEVVAEDEVAEDVEDGEIVVVDHGCLESSTW
jgi:hypothetical protein